MMIEGARPGGASWWGTVAERARACGWQLLAVVAVLTAVRLVVVELVVYVVPPYPWTRAVHIVLEALLLACEYGLAMRLLALGPLFAAVLRVPPRQLGRMALWSSLLSVPVLAQLLLALYPVVAFDLYRGPVVLVLLLAAFGGLVTAPLPAAVFLEGGGLRASWRLLCGSWVTALRLGAIAFGAFLAESLVQELYAEAFLGSDSPFLALTVQELVAPVHVLAVLALYATYLRSPAARPAVPLAGPSAAPSAYPPVEAAFGR
ncbi:hypothetical protein ACFY00_03270 [Kitasatospora sp. NPDC001540]|uniref:hypothetical protein n=1 Tax=Kitasatospora sp. NPDC001540 TaxID=3364014 RepID=UPI0036B89AB1